MKTVRTIELDGVSYAVPAGMTDNQLASICGTLLLLQRVDYCCDKEYRHSFYYTDDECVRVRIGSRKLHTSKDEAQAARDAYNATMPEKQETA